MKETKRTFTWQCQVKVRKDVVLERMHGQEWCAVGQVVQAVSDGGKSSRGDQGRPSKPWRVTIRRKFGLRMTWKTVFTKTTTGLLLDMEHHGTTIAAAMINARAHSEWTVKPVTGRESDRCIVAQTLTLQAPIWYWSWVKWFMVQSDGDWEEDVLSRFEEPEGGA
ncbi:unnamed protein product [Jaminaea pallidilutea]